MKKFSTKNLTNWSQELKHTSLHSQYKTPIADRYRITLMKKAKIECDTMRKLYNKYEVKKFFEGFGLNVPKLYYYTNKERDIKHALRDQYVAKPAHMSESDGVFINEQDFEKVNKKLNECIYKSPRSGEPRMMHQAEKGILVEEFIDYDYEFKVFVLYGCPIVGDLRNGSKEWHRIDIIDKDNDYFNWDNEYDICKQIAKQLKIDFFRIDFFYSKKEDKFYANEMAFKPSTLLHHSIENYIMNRWKEASNN